MYLIVGLGNPEEDYAKTRHNMGFDVINLIAKENNIEVNKSKFNGLYGSGIIENEKVILLKPQTFMNFSGNSIIQFVNFYKIELDHIIIICDDLDTDIGKIRIRKKGGPGTHNGMKSTVEVLNSQEFARVRVGIGMPDNKANLIEYVIGYVPNDEYKILQEGVKIASNAVCEIIKNGIDIAMNKYNLKSTSLIFIE